MTTTISPATGVPYSSAFDGIAEQYDTTFSSSIIGQLQRRPVWDELGKSFRAGDRVLDIGCGTGVDACFLAERGVDVIACDSSMRMLHVAQRKVAKLSFAGSVQLRVLPAEDISVLKDGAPLDGAFSNFGAINCVADIAKLASDLNLLLRPGASVLLCLIGPMCLWETAWYLLHGKVKKSLRRFRRHGVAAKFGDGAIVRVHYPSVRTIRDAFAPEFCLKGIRGIGVAVPPSYLEAWARRFPNVVKMAANADKSLGHCPGIRMLADHVLLRFERTA
ncbi:MAG: class I SAM-dependent methyltransferase [Candidatus Sulfotelmatobacter sp.]